MAASSSPVAVLSVGPGHRGRTGSHRASPVREKGSCRADFDARGSPHRRTVGLAGRRTRPRSAERRCRRRPPTRPPDPPRHRVVASGVSTNHRSKGSRPALRAACVSSSLERSPFPCLPPLPVTAPGGASARVWRPAQWSAARSRCRPDRRRRGCPHTRSCPRPFFGRTVPVQWVETIRCSPPPPRSRAWSLATFVRLPGAADLLPAEPTAPSSKTPARSAACCPSSPWAAPSATRSSCCCSAVPARDTGLRSSRSSPSPPWCCWPRRRCARLSTAEGLPAAGPRLRSARRASPAIRSSSLTSLPSTAGRPANAESRLPGSPARSHPGRDPLPRRRLRPPSPFVLVASVVRLRGAPWRRRRVVPPARRPPAAQSTPPPPTPRCSTRPTEVR